MYGQQDPQLQEMFAPFTGAPVGAPPDAGTLIEQGQALPMPDLSQLPPPPAALPPSVVPPPVPPMGAGSEALGALEQAAQPSPGMDPQRILDVARAVGPDTRISRQVQTAGEKAAAKGLAGTYDAQVKQAEAAGKLRGEQATDLQGQIDRENAALEQQEAQASERRAQMDRTVGEAQNYLKQQRDAYARDGVKGFHEERGTAANVATALLAGLGAYASALGGGSNGAWTVLQDSLNRHENKERARLAQRRDLVDIARQDLAGAREARAAAEIEIKNQRLAMLEKFERQRMANAAKFGVRAEQLATDATLNSIREEKAKTLFEIEKGLRSTVETSNAAQNEMLRKGLMAGGVPADKSARDATDGEKKAYSYAAQATQSLKRLKGIPEYNDRDLTELEAWRARTSEEIGKLTSDNLRSWIDAQVNSEVFTRLSPAGRRRFAEELTLGESILRPASGASISPGEWSGKFTQFQRTRGESPEMAAERAQRALSAVAGLASQSYQPSYHLKELKALTGSGSEGKMSSADAAKLLQFIQKNPNDPKAEQARKLLQQGAR